MDINPGRYFEEVNGAVDIDLERDAAEFALLRAYVDAGKPVLGGCLALLNDAVKKAALRCLSAPGGLFGGFNFGKRALAGKI